MNRGVSRFIPIIFLLVVVALIIAAIVSIARVFFFNGQPAQPVVDSSGSALLETSDSHSVRMTVRGQIVGDENFRSYQVTVSPSSRDFTRYKGYLEQPLQTKHYANNVKAYDEFVHALEKANLAAGQPLSGDANDTRGVCAGGILYEFEIREGDNAVKQLWTSTCKGSPGSLKASADQLRELFLAQVPDARQYIGKN
jgi:hypothetical protein